MEISASSLARAPKSCSVSGSACAMPRNWSCNRISHAAGNSVIGGKFSCLRLPPLRAHITASQQRLCRRNATTQTSLCFTQASTAQSGSRFRNGQARAVDFWALFGSGRQRVWCSHLQHAVRNLVGAQVHLLPEAQHHARCAKRLRQLPRLRAIRRGTPARETDAKFWIVIRYRRRCTHCQKRSTRPLRTAPASLRPSQFAHHHLCVDAAPLHQGERQQISLTTRLGIL